MTPILLTFCSDDRCDVHQCLLAVRETKQGWFDLFCPGNVACIDNGQLYSAMVRTKVFKKIFSWFLFFWNNCSLFIYLFDYLLDRKRHCDPYSKSVLTGRLATWDLRELKTCLERSGWKRQFSRLLIPCTSYSNENAIFTDLSSCSLYDYVALADDHTRRDDRNECQR